METHELIEIARGQGLLLLQLAGRLEVERAKVGILEQDQGLADRCLRDIEKAITPNGKPNGEPLWRERVAENAVNAVQGFRKQVPDGRD